METIEYALDDGVATITLNRPDARNALDPTMTAEFDQTLVRIARDDTVRAVVLTGAGGTFCAGGDVRDMNREPARTPQYWRSHLRRSHRIVKGLYTLDRPVIAAVDGAAFGAGFSIALLADIVLASSRARFCMAFGRIGLIPDYGAFYTLPRAVGLQRAKEIMFSAREIGVAEAKDLGLVLEVLAPAALLPRAQALARALAQASPAALAMTKDALNGSMNSSLDQLLELEAAGQGIAGTSAYAMEAFRRFAGKQPGLFQWPGPPAQ
jgi:2-(1,2-epoxy-1,2-dihydrophenyl)acetyl-CoA isomerase